MPEALTLNNIGGLKVTQVQQQSPFINILVYGDAGVGKTVLAGSASVVEEMQKVLFVDVEGGTMSIRERYPFCERVRINQFGELVTLFNWLKTDLRSGNPTYKTVVLDSLTEIQKFGMYDIMTRVVAADDSRDPDLPGIGEWGKNTEQMRKIIRAFRDLPCNTIMTALLTGQQQKGGKMKYFPSLSNKLAGEAAGFMDIVVYMYVGETEEGERERRLLTVKTDEYVAKDRTDMLPPVVQAPTMRMIYDICFNAQATSPSPSTETESTS